MAPAIWIGIAIALMGFVWACLVAAKRTDDNTEREAER